MGAFCQIIPGKFALRPVQRRLPRAGRRWSSRRCEWDLPGFGRRLPFLLWKNGNAAALPGDNAHIDNRKKRNGILLTETALCEWRGEAPARHDKIRNGQNTRKACKTEVAEFGCLRDEGAAPAEGLRAEGVFAGLYEGKAACHGCGAAPESGPVKKPRREGSSGCTLVSMRDQPEKLLHSRSLCRRCPRGGAGPADAKEPGDDLFGLDPTAPYAQTLAAMEDGRLFLCTRKIIGADGSYRTTYFGPAHPQDGWWLWGPLQSVAFIQDMNQYHIQDFDETGSIDSEADYAAAAYTGMFDELCVLAGSG